MSPFAPKKKSAKTRRRQFLKTSGLAVATAVIRRNLGHAQPAKFRRVSLEASDFPQKTLESYKKAISAMLALPPTDPRNWYRNAFVHTLDCPHGNWWFLPWHRGYIGWFEETCRKLSGDSTFALPFWDWTAEPRIPARFFDGVLNPSNPAYISSLAAFQKALTPPMEALWKSLTPAQISLLKTRGFQSMNDVWAQVRDNPLFFPPNQARTLTQANPGFDQETRNAVSIQMIRSALAPKTFLDFGSKKAPSHVVAPVGFGILEGQPHNNVHNNIGGFMGDFLSPVDPIFFMHHCNIDRLWDVWTRKQQKLGLPPLPTGADLATWQKEPFTFFVDSNGKPVTANKAGDYATIGRFDYSYGPGSGDDVIGATPPVLLTGSAPRLFSGTITKKDLSLRSAAVGSAKVPETLLGAATETDAPALFARVTIQPPARTKGVRFHVLVNAPENISSADSASPAYAATLEFFGSTHYHAGGEGKGVEFAVPITHALRKLRGANILKMSDPVRVHVIPDRRRGAAGEAALSGVLHSVSIAAF